jgi:hypothetical protein
MDLVVIPSVAKNLSGANDVRKVAHGKKERFLAPKTLFGLAFLISFAFIYCNKVAKRVRQRSAKPA